MNIRFLTMAETEVDNAVSWYQEQTEDQSLNFLHELDRAVQVVRAYPLLAVEIEPDIRRYLLHRFPYSLIYGLEEATIVVIAVAHDHREPGYWSDRVSDDRVDS
jgi:plasmid stabilization system protein ParE